MSLLVKKKEEFLFVFVKNEASTTLPTVPEDHKGFLYLLKLKSCFLFRTI